MDNTELLFDKNSLCEKVYEYLRNQIMSGKLPPNYRLPENELASNLQVSRAPIREALNMLVNDGFVIRVPRHGAVVAPVTRKEIDENWELRILLEPYAAKTACTLIPTEEIESVRKYIADTIVSNDFNMYMDSDYCLHQLIYQYVPNLQLQKFLNTVMLSSRRYRFYTENNAPTSAEIIKAVCEEHLSILDALLSGDSDLAFDSMKKHTEKSYQRISLQLDRVQLE